MNKKSYVRRTALSSKEAGQALYFRSLGIFSTRDLANAFNIPRTTMLNVLTKKYDEYQVDPIKTPLPPYLKQIKKEKEEKQAEKSRLAKEREERLKPYYEKRAEFALRASYIRWLRENTNLTVKAICEKYKCNSHIFYEIIRYQRFADVPPAIPPEYKN